MSRSASQPDRFARNRRAFARATELMPGGVNSPVRAFQAVGRTPIVVKSAKGAYLTDLDGNRYIDYLQSWGPLILGHAPEAVLAALSKTARRGTGFGLPTELENKLAELILSALPWCQRIRFVNSGTEAVMSAVRLARAATGRPKIIKCAGCYHGHADGLLVQAGSGATTLGVPSSPGVPQEVAGHTLVVSFNDLEAVAWMLKEFREQVAAMLVEPVAGNMGCVPPAPGYLEGLRRLCDEHGVTLIFDEVITGFRLGWGGAQQLYGVQADLTCLGKVIGGGLPCAAYAGRQELMRRVAPEGPVYQAGTLAGNPLAMAAGLATLEALRDSDAYQVLEDRSAALEAGLRQAAQQAGLKVQVQRVGSMLTVFFAEQPVQNYEVALTCDRQAFSTFFGAMLNQGVLLPPSPFECWFVSVAHSEEDIRRTVNAAALAFQEVRHTMYSSAG